MALLFFILTSAPWLALRAGNSSACPCLSACVATVRALPGAPPLGSPHPPLGATALRYPAPLPPPTRATRRHAARHYRRPAVLPHPLASDRPRSGRGP